jgi:hypothetical protein
MAMANLRPGINVGKRVVLARLVECNEDYRRAGASWSTIVGVLNERLCGVYGGAE